MRTELVRLHDAMFDTVIVAFDGSERGLDALMLADAMVSADGELVVCCVHHFQALSARIDPTEPRVDRETAKQTVAEATALLKGGAKVTPMFVAGTSTASALRKAATSKGADLVVLGSSHRGALGRVFVGSVSQETIHAAKLPVAIAPVGFHRRHQDAPLRRVAVAYDATAPVSGAVPAGVALCEETGAELLVVTVAEDRTVADPDSERMPDAEISTARLYATDQALEGVLAGLPGSVCARSEIRDGDPAEQLLDVARNVDLLVLGSHGRGLVGRLVMGSVCDVVVRASECAVLVMPPSVIPDAAEFERQRAHRRVREDLAALSITHEELRRAPEAGI